jgi:hypothetical protein
MKHHSRPENAIAALIIALFLCLGIIALAFGWMSFASLQSWLSSAAFDGKADFLTIERYRKLVIGLRLLGAAFVVIAAVFWALRRRIAKMVQSFLGGLREIFGEIAEALQRDKEQEGIWHLAALALVLFLALGLRLFFIGLPIRYDEATTYLEYASKPLPVLLSYYSSPNNHLFHSLLVHFSTLLFGDGLWAIRLPALAAGWLIVPASYLVFRLLYDKQAGLMAAALTAVCPVLVEFSTNARGYTLVTLFLLIMLALLAHLRAKPHFAGWALLVLATALGFWTVPVMAFPVAVACAWWLLSPPAGQKILSWQHIGPLFYSMAAAALLTGLLYAPVVIGSGLETLWTASGAANRQTLQQVLPNVLSEPWALAMRHWPVLVPMGFFGLFLVGFLAHWITPHRGAWVGFAAIAGSGLVLIIIRTNPYDRVWLFATPIILGICGVGLTWLLRQIKIFQPTNIAFPAAAAALMLALGVFTAALSGIPDSNEGGALRNASAITKRIAKQWQSGDAVLTACPADEPLAYHFKRERLPLASVFALLTGGLQKADRVWVVAKQPPGPTLADLLKSAGSQLKDFKRPIVIERYPEAILYMMYRQSTPKR